MASKKKGPGADKEVKPDSGQQATKSEAGKSNGSAKASGQSEKKAPRKDEKSAQAKAKTKAENGKAAAKSKKKEEDSELSESIKDIRQFLKEVVIEFRKITWPGRRQVIQETYSVLFLVTLITLMVLGFDWFLGKGIFGPLEHFARLHGGGVGR